MTLNSLRRRYVGDRAFYRMVMAVAVPMMIQNGITNFVGLLDNIMVGRVGTEPMSAVSIVNQLMFVFNLCIFGGLAGAGIFTAQYYGSGDHEGIRITFRYKLWLGMAVLAAAVVLFLLKGEALISLYLNDAGDGGDLAATLRWGQEYLRVMLLGMPPFMLVQCYASTLRECGETFLPMKAGITAVLVNLALNWLLIFGNLGFPALGVVGAAAATVISRYVELIIVVIWTHRHPKRQPWAKGVYGTMRVPAKEAGIIFRKGTPLLLNEFLWSSGVAILTQCYSVRGLTVVAALNISTTISNLFNTVFLSMGSAVSIIVGQRLGAGQIEEARDTDRKLIVFSVVLSFFMGLLLVASAPLFPRIYRTEEAVRSLAAQLIIAGAVFMPQQSFMNATYFTLRAGGKTVITFLFDSVSIWCVSIPIAFCLSRFTSLYVVWILVAVHIGDWVKCALGYLLVKRGAWARNIVQDGAAEP